MKLTFLGTRGNIIARSRKHWRHTATLVSFRGKHVMIDCGDDWLRHVKKINPHAIIISHAHNDHVGGLRNGAPCPVYATRESWDVMRNYPIENKRVMRLRRPEKIFGMTVEAFRVEHALNAPAVGYRITAGKRTIFYVPDLVKIKGQRAALRGIVLYIGDGAIISRYLLVRRRNKHRIGHSPIVEQLKWCQKEKVPRMIITHCGTEIVTGKKKIIAEKIQALEKEFGLRVAIAFDGLVIVVR